VTVEWLVLAPLVPAILVPVVLLWGFAGCGFPGIGSVLRPTNVRAEGISVSEIRLTWENPHGPGVTFEVERTKEGETIPQTLAMSETTLIDSGLEEATTYFYTVTAMRIEYNDDSGPSDRVAGRTIGVAFEAGLTNDQTGWEGYCMVQRIEPARLRQSTLPGDMQTPGARVRITVRGSTAASLTLDRIYISRPAASGDPYDSAGDLIPVASGVVVPANAAVALDLIDYDLDRTSPLLIAFDISSNAGAGNLRHIAGVPATDATTYFRPATVEASNSSRSPGYLSSATIYVVEKIEVV
jgi:hypothetical protein